MSKHFDDDYPCTVPDNPNLYFPTDPIDWLKNKKIKQGKKWFKCYIGDILIAKCKSLDFARDFLNAL